MATESEENPGKYNSIEKEIEDTAAKYGEKVDTTPEKDAPTDKEDVPVPEKDAVATKKGAPVPEKDAVAAKKVAPVPEKDTVAAKKGAPAKVKLMEEGGEIPEHLLKKDEEAPKSIEQERSEFIRDILGKETFIAPLNGDEIASAYSAYESNPQKIIDVLTVSFQGYCRKCIKEIALMRVKNELSIMLIEEAEAFTSKVVDELNKKVQKDPALEHLLMMMLFKSRFWSWVRFGLKDIFKEQREMPGNKLNTYFNHRFHKMKGERKFRKVGDLIIYDIVEIVNHFKTHILKKDSRIFGKPPSVKKPIQTTDTGKTAEPKETEEPKQSESK